MSETISPAELRAKQESGEQFKLIDVRKKSDYEADKCLISGASWRDPETLAEWSKDLSLGEEVVVYCVRGGPVSKSVSRALRDKGIDVRNIEGGLVAWKESGGETASE